MAFMDKDRVRISLHVNRDYFIPGDTLRGRLHLTVTKNVTLAAVRLRATGKEESFRVAHYRSTLLEEFVHFERVLTFIGEPASGTSDDLGGGVSRALVANPDPGHLAAGEYDYPFKVQIPAASPPSLNCVMKAAKTKVYYYLEASAVFRGSGGGVHVEKRLYITIFPAARRAQWDEAHRVPRALTAPPQSSSVQRPSVAASDGPTGSVRTPNSSPSGSGNSGNASGANPNPNTRGHVTDEIAAEKERIRREPFIGVAARPATATATTPTTTAASASASATAVSAAVGAAGVSPALRVVEDGVRLPVRGERGFKKDPGFLELGVRVMPHLLALGTRDMFPIITASNEAANTRVNRPTVASGGGDDAGAVHSDDDEDTPPGGDYTTNTGTANTADSVDSDNDNDAAAEYSEDPFMSLLDRPFRTDSGGVAQFGRGGTSGQGPTAPVDTESLVSSTSNNQDDNDSLISSSNNYGNDNDDPITMAAPAVAGDAEDMLSVVTRAGTAPVPHMPRAAAGAEQHQQQQQSRWADSELGGGVASTTATDTVCGSDAGTGMSMSATVRPAAQKGNPAAAGKAPPPPPQQQHQRRPLPPQQQRPGPPPLGGGASKVPSVVRPASAAAVAQPGSPACGGLATRSSSTSLGYNNTNSSSGNVTTYDDCRCLVRLTVHNGMRKRKVRGFTVVLLQLRRFASLRHHATETVKVAEGSYTPPRGPLLPGQTITVDVPLLLPEMLRANGEMDKRLPLPTLRIRTLEVSNCLAVSFKGSFRLQHQFACDDAVAFVSAVDESNRVPLAPASFMVPFVFPEEVVRGQVY